MARILILTQYYPPETGAPQNRLSSLARHLKALGKDVSVLTAMPNYPQMKTYEAYKGKLYVKEEIDGIPVHRAWIFTSEKHKIVLRLMNYFSFVFTALIAGLFKVKKQDIIICESPPLFLGITALLLCKIKRSKLVFNVSDLWPESAKELGIINSSLLINISRRLEEGIYKRSALISGQTQGIVADISKRIPGKPVYWLRNGIDVAQFNDREIAGNWRADNGFSASDFIILYGGVLGYAQNLEVILKAAKIVKDEKDIKFVIVGDGPNRENLLMIKDSLHLENVFFLPAQTADKMPAIIDACNAGVIPLRNLPLFKGAIPSKIFEYLIFAKPILLGVDGEARALFIDEGKCGLFFTPQDQKELAEHIITLKNDLPLSAQFGNSGKSFVLNKFDRKKIAFEFNEQVDKLLN